MSGGGVHRLITGLNGHGKTLYTVAEILRPLVGSTIDYKGQPIPRRLVIGGIKDLLLEHELMEVPTLDPESFKDEWRGHVREPGDEPHQVVCSAVNWWLWCMPGDVIVIDECQRLFRPMASGRRIPMFIEKLETARHYGVQFVYITQHPQLLHTNVRNLVGPHEHVRRIYGGATTVVYQWDHCTNPDRVKNATSRIWKHKKAAFGLYKSAELHTSFRQRLPLAVWALGLGLVVLAYLSWFIYGRMQQRFGTPTAAPAEAVAGATPAAAGSGGAAGAGPAAGPWPVLRVSQAVKNREPYADLGVHLAGCLVVGDAPGRCWFFLSVGGERLGVITIKDLLAAGYSWRQLAPCAGVLIFGEAERAVTCDAPTGARRGHIEPGAPAEPGGGSFPAGGSAAKSGGGTA